MSKKTSKDAIWREFFDSMEDRNWGYAARIALVNPDVVPLAMAKALLSGRMAYHRKESVSDQDALNAILSSGG